ncbi:synaptosomal-associated protein 47-like [Stegodyphus dumicola]|uniref:synaptosomal-associated protein 47-like n=1 Tax=Stegodyphus dumicola TaxID=202533 RepID=UPI0015B08294|nr:synaptosomal-associated protein 47-like [Stegodyphus dumicola]
MAGKSNVFESKATYYNPASKKWETGVFTLNKNFFQFVSDSNNSDQLHLYFPLSTISGLEKRQSSLIYAALVISVGSEKHWFASFPSRDCVYNLVELFWRESLLSRPIKTPSSQKAKANSALGKELLNILYESENTLVDAANTLSDQGRQLHEAQNEIKDINEDITVAEKFLKMHFSQAIVKMSATNPNVNETNQESEQRTKKYKVTFSFSGISNDNNSWQKGTLLISDDVKLLDEHYHGVIQITQDELETFQVLSPWELSITYSTNSRIHSCYLMCPQLSRLLKFLSISSFKTKIVFEDDTSSAYETASSSSSYVTSEQAYEIHRGKECKIDENELLGSPFLSPQ